ncbi:MAG TPA: hypothetical protein GX707_16495 [Epulopiscium sp.]|nr:hypothetical protein [Candidatus Epulonipiscium sp.]
MDYVLMIIAVLAIILYPQKDTFINKFKVKANLKGIEVNISTKEKNGPPYKSDRFNSEK